MKRYIINNSTIALIKKNSNTLIIEEKKTILSKRNIMSIINESCKFYGSDYKGRISAIREFINSKYKIPILINENNNLIFFPTESIRNENVIFINYKKVLKYENFNDYIRIKLTNNIMLTTKISKYSFNEQLLKCLLINNIINNRKKL